MPRKANARKVEIQKYDHDALDWKPLPLSDVKFNDDALIIGGPFRILVNGKSVFTTMTEDLADV